MDLDIVEGLPWKWVLGGITTSKQRHLISHQHAIANSELANEVRHDIVDTYRCQRPALALLSEKWEVVLARCVLQNASRRDSFGQPAVGETKVDQSPFWFDIASPDASTFIHISSRPGVRLQTRKFWSIWILLYSDWSEPYQASLYPSRVVWYKFAHPKGMEGFLSTVVDRTIDSVRGGSSSCQYDLLVILFIH